MRNIPLYRQIEQHYLDLITEGTLKHNDRLPTEFEMTNIFGVSRITVIKAMKELEKRGLIVRHTKTGTFVNCRNKDIVKQLTIPIVLPYNNLLNFDIIRGAQKFALINSAVIPFYNTFNDPKTEREILLSLERMNIDGLLLYPCSSLENLDILSRFAKKKVPLVFLDRGILGTSFPLVTSDNFGGMHRLVRAMIRLGYKKFGYYGVTRRLISTEKDRFDGFCSAILDAGLEIRPDWIFELEDEVTEKYRYAKLDGEDEGLLRSSSEVIESIQKMDERPDVVCCTNDFAAVNLFETARNAGLRIPEDLGITGFDGISLPVQGIPTLTTVSQDFEGIGKAALDTVCKIIAGETVDAVTLIPTRPSLNDSVRSKKENAKSLEELREPTEINIFGDGNPESPAQVSDEDSSKA